MKAKHYAAISLLLSSCSNDCSGISAVPERKGAEKGHDWGLRDWCEPKTLHFSIQRSAQRLCYKGTLLSPRATLVSAWLYVPTSGWKWLFFCYKTVRIYQLCLQEHRTKPHINMIYQECGSFINYTTVWSLWLVLSIMETYIYWEAGVSRKHWRLQCTVISWLQIPVQGKNYLCVV